MKLALTHAKCFKRDIGSRFDTKLCGKEMSFSMTHASTPSKLRKDRLARLREVTCIKDPDWGDGDFEGAAAMTASVVTAANNGLGESLGGI